MKACDFHKLPDEIRLRSHGCAYTHVCIPYFELCLILIIFSAVPVSSYTYCKLLYCWPVIESFSAAAIAATVLYTIRGKRDNLSLFSRERNVTSRGIFVCRGQRTWGRQRFQSTFGNNMTYTHRKHFPDISSTDPSTNGNAYGEELHVYCIEKDIVVL